MLINNVEQSNLKCQDTSTQAERKDWQKRAS